jgi:hypothetical protein
MQSHQRPKIPKSHFVACLIAPIYNHYKSRHVKHSELGQLLLFVQFFGGLKDLEILMVTSH